MANPYRLLPVINVAAADRSDPRFALAGERRVENKPNSPRRRFRVGRLAQSARPLSHPCGALLIAAIVAGTAIMVDNLRDRALFDSERELKNTALILAEQIDRTFQAVDLVQISVIERIQSLGITSSDDYARRISSKDIHEMLKTSTSGLVQIYAISVINADGRLLNFSRFWPVPDISVADREFFLALKSDPKLTSFV